MTIAVRPVELADSDDIFNWRNDPETRRMFHSMEIVPRRDHDAWFAGSLTNDTRFMFMCIDAQDAQKIAFVRFDLSKVEATISINLAPEMRGKGLARPCLLEAIACFQRKKTGGQKLLAEVKASNVASSRLFASAGFVPVRDRNGVLTYELGL